MSIKKLSLNRETLRTLSDRESSAAAGGGIYTESGPKACWNDATGGDTFGNTCRTTLTDCAPLSYLC